MVKLIPTKVLENNFKRFSSQILVHLQYPPYIKVLTKVKECKILCDLISMVIPMKVSKSMKKENIENKNSGGFSPGIYCHPYQSRDDIDGATQEKDNSGETKGC